MNTISWAMALISASVSLGIAAPHGASERHAYQLVAVQPDAREFGFVDAASIKKEGASASYWWLTVYEPPLAERNGSPILYQMRQRIADCANHKNKDAVMVARYQNGDERWTSIIGHYRSVRPGTVGDSEISFVCTGVKPVALAPAFDSLDAAVAYADLEAHHRSEQAALPSPK